MNEASPAMVAQVAEIVRLVGKLAPETKVSSESRLSEDFGIDSLDQVSILMKIEDSFGLEINDDDVSGLQTVGELADHVARTKAAAA
ncbi:acyl carrier protein [Isosphaeraceae bacterium EP7]